MNFFLILISFLSLAWPVFSMEAKSDLSSRLERLSLQVKELCHQSMIYRTLRFPNTINNKQVKEIIRRDEELVDLGKKYILKSSRLNPIDDEQVIIDELRKEYYLRPQAFELSISYGPDLPKEWFPLDIAFISHAEASRAILIPMDLAFAPLEERKPGHHSLRLPHLWCCPKNSYIKYIGNNWQEINWHNLLQKNNSFFIHNGNYKEQHYQEGDWNILFDATSRLQKIACYEEKYGENLCCISKQQFAYYFGADEALSFSYSILFRTQTGLVYQDDFLKTFAPSHSYKLEKDNFVHPQELY
jgi:hypothetical protein